MKLVFVALCRPQLQQRSPGAFTGRTTPTFLVDGPDTLSNAPRMKMPIAHWALNHEEILIRIMHRIANTVSQPVLFSQHCLVRFVVLHHSADAAIAPACLHLFAYQVSVSRADQNRSGTKWRQHESKDFRTNLRHRRNTTTARRQVLRCTVVPSRCHTKK